MGIETNFLFSCYSLRNGDVDQGLLFTRSILVANLSSNSNEFCQFLLIRWVMTSPKGIYISRLVFGSIKSNVINSSIADVIYNVPNTP